MITTVHQQFHKNHHQHPCRSMNEERSMAAERRRQRKHSYYQTRNHQHEWTLISCIIVLIVLLNQLSLAESNRMPSHLNGNRNSNGGHTLSFTQEPNSILVAVDGKRTSFKCEVDPPHAEIKWLINGQELTDSTVQGLRVQRNKVIVALSSNQNLNLTALHSSTIQCIGQLGDHAIISQPAKLLIAALSDFADEPQHNRQQSIEHTVTVIAGNTAVIKCTAPFSVPQAVTEFDHNGVIIDKSTGNYRRNFDIEIDD